MPMSGLKSALKMDGETLNSLLYSYYRSPRQMGSDLRITYSGFGNDMAIRTNISIILESFYDQRNASTITITISSGTKHEATVNGWNRLSREVSSYEETITFELEPVSS
jgi:hypothetical protein